jgi:hypothetical protein
MPVLCGNRGGPWLAVGGSRWRVSRPGKEENGSGLKRTVPALIYSKKSKRLELIQSKVVLPVLQKFQIKYGIEYFEIRNTFSYWKFSNFGIEFELKNLRRF